MKRLFLAAVLCLTSNAFAHQTQVVADRYKVIFGMVTEPAYTLDRNGIDLIVRTIDDQAVEGLEKSLTATITAPNGKTRTLKLRGQYKKPGYYTDDLVFTQAGVYKLNITGFIGDKEVNLSFNSHEVENFAKLRFP